MSPINRTAETSKYRPALVFALLLLALLIRIPYIVHHPSGFHKGRQYYDRLISRGLYYQYFAGKVKPADRWNQEVAIEQGQKQERLEPPVFQMAVALGYAVAGGEREWVPRVLAVGIWFWAALALYQLAKKWFGSEIACFSAFLFLFFPYGIIISTSFQPDILMLVMLLFSIQRIIDYFQGDADSSFLSTALVSILAVWIKPLCLFPILGAFCMGIWQRDGLKKALLNFQLWIFFLGLVLPVAGHYVYRIVTGDFLQWQFQVSILPYLILTPHFWLGWKGLLGIVIGFVPLLFAVTGLFLFRNSKARAIMIGYGIGYFIFGLVFTYQIHTHEYYQLMLMPWICLGVAALAERAKPYSGYFKKSPWVFLMLILAAGIFGKIWGKTKYIERSYQFSSQEQTIANAKKIGEATLHSTRMIYLPGSWGAGKMLQYYGWVSGLEWPSQEQMNFEIIRRISRLSAEERFRNYQKYGSWDYFVVADLEQLALQGDLKMFLNRSFPVVFHDPNFLIYDLKKPLKSL